MTNNEKMAKQANALNTIFASIKTENIGIKIELKLNTRPDIWIYILNKDSESFVFFYLTKAIKNNEKLNKLIEIYMQDDIEAMKAFSKKLGISCIDND